MGQLKVDSTWVVNTPRGTVTVWCGEGLAVARCDTCWHQVTVRHPNPQVARADAALAMDTHLCGAA